jgi:hypothetical protein
MHNEVLDQNEYLLMTIKAIMGSGKSYSDDKGRDCLAPPDMVECVPEPDWTHVVGAHGLNYPYFLKDLFCFVLTLLLRIL